MTTNIARIFGLQYASIVLMETESTSLSSIKSGTGFMISLSETIPKLISLGYTENLVPCFDHLSCQLEKIQLYPKDLHVDAIIRFENASDPDDQSILYAVSSTTTNLKGLYVDSYGIYHDDLSREMLECLKDHT